MRRVARIGWVVPFLLGAGGCGIDGDTAGDPVGEATEAVESSSLDVAFTDCVESIGVGLVDTASARAYVPAEFVLAGDGAPVTPLVVRTSRCAGIAVGTHAPKAGAIVQIGAVIVPPDFTGDINNYTFWYETTDAKLANRLGDLGVQAQHVANIDYDVDLGAGSRPFHVKVPKKGDPSFMLDGTVVPSSVAAGSFEANWWQSTCGGTVKMDTLVPTIDIGTADLVLTAKPGSPLADLFGGTTGGFPALQQFNTFAAAHMHAELSPDGG